MKQCKATKLFHIATILAITLMLVTATYTKTVQAANISTSTQDVSIEKNADDLYWITTIETTLNKSFPIFRTIDFCKKAPLLSHLQIPAYTLTELFCKNYTTLQIKSGIAPSVACQIVLKSIVYIVLFCYNWTIYFTQFS